MTKIIGLLYNDNLKIFVYNNGLQVEGKKCTLNNCAKTIAMFAEVYNVNIINLIGDSQLSQIIGKELKNKYSLKTSEMI